MLIHRGVARGKSEATRVREIQNFADQLTLFKLAGQIMSLRLLPALRDSKNKGGLISESFFTLVGIVPKMDVKSVP